MQVFKDPFHCRKSEILRSQVNNKDPKNLQAESIIIWNFCSGVSEMENGLSHI